MTKLKILSWNIWIEGNFEEMARFLQNTQADIIGLQEVLADNPARDTIKFLSTLGYSHVFAPITKVWGGKTWNDGPAVFSKYPIVEQQTYILSTVKGRAAARADIKVGENVLHVFSTHLIHTHQQPSEEQEEQGRKLLEIIPSEKSILIGDLNATPESNTIKNISSALVDTDPISQPTWSVYPEGCSFCKPEQINTKLDYIFTTSDLKTNDFKVEQSQASDHLPISLTLKI